MPEVSTCGAVEINGESTGEIPHEPFTLSSKAIVLGFDLSAPTTVEVTLSVNGTDVASGTTKVDPTEGGEIRLSADFDAPENDSRLPSSGEVPFSMRVSG